MSQPTPVAAPQPYLPPQYVMMPMVERNGLGVFGFLVALVGLAIPTGLVSFLGLMISLVAVGRRPRGLAASGVVLGLIGTAVWLVISIVALVVALVGALAAAVVAALAFALVQPEVVEVTSDMVNVVIAAKHHEQTRSDRPTDLDELGLSVATLTDPWGNRYEFELTDADPGFDLVSAGRDGRFGTPDDMMLSRLDRVWEQAFEEFGEKMEELGEKLESMDGNRYSFQWHEQHRGDSYYRKAVSHSACGG